MFDVTPALSHILRSVRPRRTPDFFFFFLNDRPPPELPSLPPPAPLPSRPGGAGRAAPAPPPRRSAPPPPRHSSGVETVGCSAARSEYTHTVVLRLSFWLQSIRTSPRRRDLVIRETTRSGSAPSSSSATALAKGLVCA